MVDSTISRLAAPSVSGPLPLSVAALGRCDRGCLRDARAYRGAQPRLRPGVTPRSTPAPQRRRSRGINHLGGQLLQGARRGFADPGGRPAGGAQRALYASVAVSPPAITSPVERISAARFGGAGEAVLREDRLLRPRARRASPAPGRSSSASEAPSIRRQAMSTSGIPVALATNGHRSRRARVRLDHRQLAAQERELEVEQPACARAGERARRELADLRPRAPAVTDGPGITQAESPEWTPAGSMCSRIPATQAASPSQRMSTSSSSAPSRNSSTSDGSWISSSSGRAHDAHAPARRGRSAA